MRIRNVLACGAAMTALGCAGAFAQSSGGVESVVVTGSRVISNIANSPTPLTVVSTASLEATSPADIPEGLNKLPVFQGSQTIGRPGDGSKDYASNTLNLRNFGAQRTLVLFNGHRAAPSNSDGTVSIDTLPQMLVSRVDVVTGGASAVYGSDAVTGVVNFVLNKDFDGLRIDASAGVSTYGDAAGYKAGVAYGTDLLGNRGHFEGSLEYRYRDPVNQSARPYGPPSSYWTTEGTGKADNPISYVRYGRRENSSFAGVVQACKPACPLAQGTEFSASGSSLVPYDRGIRGGVDANGNPTKGSSNRNSGGGGAYSPYGQVFSAYRAATAFGRFSYDLTDDINVYVQGQASEAYSFGWYFPMKVQPGAGQAAIFYKNNPYLTAAQQAQLGNDGTNPLQNPNASPAVQPSNTFQLGKFFVGLGQAQTNATRSVNRVLGIQTGANGTLMNGRFNWEIFYTHAENRQAVDLLNNQNLQQMYAAQDAVLTPAGNVACYAATQAATAAKYAHCAPINVFGIGNVTWPVHNNIFEMTKFNETNVLDDMGASISGKVIDAWAGPITAALSAEMRFQKYGVRSNVPSSTNVDCTGLRICNAALPLYSQTILQPTDADGNVWEMALESEVPLVRNVPLIQALDLNLAGRYTDYSTSGSVETWKVGFSWSVIDALRFRGTTSIDIRAPTLDDLYRPATLLENVYTDLHVIVPGGGNYTSTTTFSSQGNPKLKPEVARTYTVGFVLTPDNIPGLTVSLDYFRIHMANSIGQIGPSTTIQTLCENSGGTSIYCDNYQRPFPFSDHSIDNYATRLFTFNLNTASVETEGWDFEADYSWEMSDIVSDWQGSWVGRLLTTYQPVTQKSVLFPGAPWTRTPSSPVRTTVFLNYKLNAWTVGLQDTWVSGFSQVGGPVTPLINNWVHPQVRSWNQVDLNVARDFTIDGADVTGYLTVQNVFNRQPDYVPNGTIGQWYPVATNGYSVQSPMGRYFTIGLRSRL